MFTEHQAEEDAANAAALCTSCGEGAPAPARGPSWRRPQSGTGCSLPPPISGVSVDSDGGLAPLAPHVEFKIIDYGVGEFNETLAQAAGGHEPEETHRRIRDVFAARGIMLGPDAKKTAAATDLAGDDVPTKRCKNWKLCPFKSGRFAVTSEAAAAAPTAAKPKTPTSSLSAMSSGRGPVERMYRHFWDRKGDVFHLVLALALVLDDRVWPRRDERDVQLFVSLVHHVTGVKLKAHFASADGTDPKRLRVMGQHKKGAEEVYGARVRCFAALRRAQILAAAHLKPFNSGLLAGEALVAPFFGMKGAPHAELPVCVESAFPAVH